MVNKFRDISIIELGGKKVTVTCDSCSGVGILSGDIVNSSGYFTGYRTAFVALAETIALGAIPQLIVNTLSVPMNEYGKELLCGIKDAASDAGLTGENSITGSTEDNFAVSVTSIGITVIGELKQELPSYVSSPLGVYLAGLPLSGEQVVSAKDEILSFDALNIIRADKNAADIIPVGSKGISYEISQMESDLYAEFVPVETLSVDLNTSAGPATCAVFAMDGDIESIKSSVCIPIIKLGDIYPK